MKVRPLSLPACPFGVEVQTTNEGLLLKPRRQPREGWAKAFRVSRKAVPDELTDVREARNDLDERQWQW